MHHAHLVGIVQGFGNLASDAQDFVHLQELPVAEAAGDLLFQRAAVDTLVGRALQAAEQKGLDRIVIAGGVGANKLLRQEMAARFSGDVFYPRMAYCTDNGAMLAVAGALRLADAGRADEIRAQARWSLDTLSVPGE